MLRLAAVNFFLACVGVVQVSRIMLYQQSVKNATPGQITEKEAGHVSKTAKEAAEGSKAATKNAVS